MLALLRTASIRGLEGARANAGGSPGVDDGVGTRAHAGHTLVEEGTLGQPPGTFDFGKLGHTASVEDRIGSEQLGVDPGLQFVGWSAFVPAKS